MFPTKLDFMFSGLEVEEAVGAVPAEAATMSSREALKVGFTRRGKKVIMLP